MYNCRNNRINLIRGDSLELLILINDIDGNPFKPQPTDRLRFAMKKEVSDDYVVALQKEIPVETLLLKIEPEDTKNLDFGNYYYDIELTTKEGVVETIIPYTRFVIDGEVH